MSLRRRTEAERKAYIQGYEAAIKSLEEKIKTMKSSMNVAKSVSANDE